MNKVFAAFWYSGILPLLSCTTTIPTTTTTTTTTFENHESLPRPQSTKNAGTKAKQNRKQKKGFLWLKDQWRSVADKSSACYKNGGMRQSSSFSDVQSQGVGSSIGPIYSYSSVHGGVEGESAQRCKARLERHRRTAERAAKALAEKNRLLEEKRGKSSVEEKTSIEARLRAERAAVERAAAEARQRAFQKVMAEKAAFEARERVERSVADKSSACYKNGGMRQCSSFSDVQSQGVGSSIGPIYSYSSVHGGVEGESAQRCKARLERHRRTAERVEGESTQRCKARLERHRRTAERVAKALAEKNRLLGKSSMEEKTSMEARLRAERAAVERAAAEARQRAFQKVMAEKAAFEARERVERSVADKSSACYKNGGMRQSSSFSDVQSQGVGSSIGPIYSYSSVHGGVEGESAQRCKARLERHRRTAERAVKALAEKNIRDLVAQREQAERNRLAEALDAEVKRWSSGKEANLRALLSTLQYILGPDSGWLPIPLTEVITSAAVKKAYRKATLCVHPDKLQQGGASVQQKYICEKVFDLLKTKALAEKNRLLEEEQHLQLKKKKKDPLKPKTSMEEKTSMEARLRAERAAVERATAEARQRAFQKVMVELKAAFEARERVERSVADKSSACYKNGGMRQSSSFSDVQSQGVGSSIGPIYSYSSVHGGVEGESAQRSKARLERHRRAAEHNSTFSWGLGVGNMCMMSAGKAEISRLNTAVDETTKVVQELKTEFSRRKSSRNLQVSSSKTEISTSPYKTRGKHTEPIPQSSTENRDNVQDSGVFVTEEGECANSVLTEEPQQEVLEMDRLEAELEFELQKLPWCSTEASGFEGKISDICENEDASFEGFNKPDGQTSDSCQLSGVLEMDRLEAELESELQKLPWCSTEASGFEGKISDICENEDASFEGFYKPNGQTSDSCQLSGVLEMDRLEVELESELQKLPWCSTEASGFEGKISDICENEDASFEGFYKPDAQTSDSCQLSGVLPSELDQKLCHLLIEQQESQIVGLESELHWAQSKLHEKEAELQALKDCIKRLTEFSLATASDEESEAQKEEEKIIDHGDYDNKMGPESKRSVVGMKRSMDFEPYSCDMK